VSGSLRSPLDSIERFGRRVLTIHFGYEGPAPMQTNFHLLRKDADHELFHFVIADAVVEVFKLGVAKAKLCLASYFPAQK
jgi:hypothetical protein